MKDILTHIGFDVHISLSDGQEYTKEEYEKMMDRIQTAVESDDRCEMMVTNLHTNRMERRVVRHL